jgi:thiamine biosynthesis lipoprotein
MRAVNDSTTERDVPPQFRFIDGKFIFGASCMGTGFLFRGQSPLDASQTLMALQHALGVLDEADRTFSLYKPESPVSRLARGETSLDKCPPVVAEVWDACESWEKITDGWFSAFTPEHTFDPSGLVKTWAASRACEQLLNAGIIDFTLDAGGDILLSDALTEAANWKVGVRKPVSMLDPEAGLLTVVNLENTPFRAVCTSGSAERGRHIWNPKMDSLTNTEAVVQATAIAAHLVTADVWATAAYAEGPRAVEHLNRYNTANPQNQVQLLLVYPDGTLNATDGFEALLAKPESAN